jgi:hypothetical protein
LEFCVSSIYIFLQYFYQILKFSLTGLNISYAILNRTDDVVSIGSSIAEGLSKDELMFFKRLEYELTEMDDNLEDEMDGAYDYKSRAGSRGESMYELDSRGSDKFSNFDNIPFDDGFEEVDDDGVIDRDLSIRK